MDRLSPEQLDSKLHELLDRNIEIAKPERNIDTENVADILARMDHAPFLPVPESPADYPQAVTEYFNQNLNNNFIEFKIPLFHIEDRETQEQILTAIGSALRESIFKYCQDLIDTVPEDERMLPKLPLGETALDVRHSEETSLVHSIYVLVKKETGHIFLNIINPTDFDSEAFDPERPEGGTLLVPIAANLARDAENPADVVNIHKQIHKVVANPDSPEPEIVANDCEVDIDLPTQSE